MWNRGVEMQEKKSTGESAFYSPVTEVYDGRRYFDFGISNEDGGRYLNRGLAAQKEGFGGRAVVHDFYEVDCR